MNHAICILLLMIFGLFHAWLVGNRVMSAFWLVFLFIAIFILSLPTLSLP